MAVVFAPLIDKLPDWLYDSGGVAVQHVMVSSIDDDVLTAGVERGDEVLL